jgi:hypothetical protein
MTGPIPERIIGRFRKGPAVEIRSLACLSHALSPKREEVEARIFKVCASYSATLAALRLSPTRAEILDAITEKQGQIATMLCWLADPMPLLKPKPVEEERGERNLQFHSALGDLLEARGYSFHAFKTTAEQALAAVRALDLIATEMHAAIEVSVEDDLFVEISERNLRSQFFRTLHKIMRESGLDVGVGAKSLITFLVMELEENPKLGNPDEEADYRKGLARQIKLAVKDGEANELAAPSP